MRTLFTAANEVVEWLAKHHVRGCVIGGVALQRWGQPRLTQDVDLTVVADIGDEERVVDLCLEKFRPRRDDARAFALQYRVVLLYASNDVPLDIALGATSFEAECVERATGYEYEPGCVLPTCSAEDLIIHKTFAGRPRDIDDVRGIVNRQLGNLDLARIRRWLTVLAEVKEAPDLARPFEEALHAAEAIAAKRKQSR